MPARFDLPRFAARLRAWPSAWPLPSGPLGWQRSPALRGGSRRSFLRSGLKRSSGALDAGGASPDNVRRSGSCACGPFARRLVRLAHDDRFGQLAPWHMLGPLRWGARRGRGGASARGQRPAPVRFRAGGSGPGCPATCGESPATPSPPRRDAPPSSFNASSCMSRIRCEHASGRSARRAEGAPLKL